MRNPLAIAVAGALVGFGGWIWLTGPGTSVPNAFLALLSAILCGRAAWWLAARNALGDGDIPVDTAPAERTAPSAQAPTRSGQRTPPPQDAESWRRPERGPEREP